MDLLRWVVQSVLLAVPSMQPYCLCFRALCNGMDVLNNPDEGELATTQSCAG